MKIIKTRVSFTESDLGEKAFAIYSDSSGCFDFSTDVIYEKYYLKDGETFDTLQDVIDYILAFAPKKLMMQYTYNGEKFEIWTTFENDLELALAEMDERPTESGIVFFEGEKEFITLNGGFK